jgi:hypothetical protein
VRAGVSLESTGRPAGVVDPAVVGAAACLHDADATQRNRVIGRQRGNKREKALCPRRIIERMAVEVEAQATRWSCSTAWADVNVYTPQMGLLAPRPASSVPILPVPAVHLSAGLTDLFKGWSKPACAPCECWVRRAGPFRRAFHGHDPMPAWRCSSLRCEEPRIDRATSAPPAARRAMRARGQGP